MTHKEMMALLSACLPLPSGWRRNHTHLSFSCFRLVQHHQSAVLNQMENPGESFLHDADVVLRSCVKGEQTELQTTTLENATVNVIGAVMKWQ